MQYSRPLLVFWVLFVVSGHLFAQSQAEAKQVVRSFKASPSITVDITNKYGKIHIVNWAKDSVRFDIKLSGSGSDGGELKKLINSVDFNFAQSQFFITAITEFKSAKTGIFGDLKELTQNLVAAGGNLQIDYEVYLPKYVNIKVNHKFGDLYMEDIKSDISIELSNGNLTAGNLSGELNLNLSFANTDIASVANGTVNASYLELYIGTAQKLTLNSKSCKLHLGTVELLKFQSKRDDYKIAKATYAYGDTYFTHVEIAELLKEGSMEMKYGKLLINRIYKGFVQVNAHTKYTDIDLYFDKGANYQMDITHKNAKFSYPVATGKLEQTENHDGISTKGTIGVGNSKSKLIIKAEGNTVNIR